MSKCSDCVFWTGGSDYSPCSVGCNIWYFIRYADGTPEGYESGDDETACICFKKDPYDDPEEKKLRCCDCAHWEGYSSHTIDYGCTVWPQVEDVIENLDTIDRYINLKFNSSGHLNGDVENNVCPFFEANLSRDDEGWSL